MNTALQDEIDKMEEERLSLKAQLRLNAVEVIMKLFLLQFHFFLYY